MDAINIVEVLGLIASVKDDVDREYSQLGPEMYFTKRCILDVLDDLGEVVQIRYNKNFPMDPISIFLKS